MNKRERFMSFLANKPVDRVPIAFFHHVCDPEGYDKGTESEFYFEQNVEGNCRIRDRFEPDLVKVMNDSLFTPPFDLSFVKESKDLRKIEPLPENHPYNLKSMELTKRIREFYGDEVPLYATVFSPLYVFRVLMATGGMPGLGGNEARFLQFMGEDPESCAYALNVISEGIISLDNRMMKESGADGIYLSVNNWNGTLKNEVYRQYVTPSEKAVLDAANAIRPMNILHICGFYGMTNDLSLFRDYDAAVYNWNVHAESVGLKEGKKYFGGRPVLGGFAQSPDGVIYCGTKEEVKAETKRILYESGQTGIMLGADCTVPQDIDEHRFEWVREAATEFAAGI